MNTPYAALEQSYLRTKARNYAEYKKTMELRANSSNNTIYADADGDIAYWQGDFIPIRDPRFDYTKPVDGSDPATNWQGLTTVDDLPHLLNPKIGYLFNVNDSPWNGAGANSLRKPTFLPTWSGESRRRAECMPLGCSLPMAHRGATSRWRPMLTAYDSYLPWFARTIPVLPSVRRAPCR